MGMTNPGSSSSICAHFLVIEMLFQEAAWPGIREKRHLAQIRGWPGHDTLIAGVALTPEARLWNLQQAIVLRLAVSSSSAPTAKGAHRRAPLPLGVCCRSMRRKDQTETGSDAYSAFHLQGPMVERHEPASGEQEDSSRRKAMVLFGIQ